MDPLEHNTSLTFSTHIYHGQQIPNEPFWPALLKLINDAWRFPPDISPLALNFTRLEPSLAGGAAHFRREMGPDGYMAILFAHLPASDGTVTDEEKPLTPVACVGYQPFLGSHDYRDRGKPLDKGGLDPAHINASSAHIQPRTVSGWELVLVATSPRWQGRGFCDRLLKLVEQEIRERVSRERPGDRVNLSLSTIEELGGGFWRGKGWREVEGGGYVIPRGWTHLVGWEGVRKDVGMWTGEKWL